MFKMNPKARVKAREKTPALPLRLTEAQAAAMLRAKEAELAARELEARAAFDRERLEAERAAWRADQDKVDRAARLVQTRDQWSTVVAKVVPYLPLVLVNVMAVMGQFGWGRANLDQIGASPDHVARMAVALLFAGALESLALFQGYYADKALQRRDSAAGLYAGAFGTAAIVAALNYSHYASPRESVTVLGLEVPAPTPTAVVFALFSFISPALWRIHSRAKNRDALKAAGEIDTRAVRLSWSRKLWHPVRTVVTMYLVTWDKDVKTPAEAVALYDSWKAAKRVAKEAKRAEDAKAPEKAPEKEEAPTPGPEPTPEPTPELEPGRTPAPIVAQRWPEAWDAYAASVRGGNKLTQRALAREYLGNNRHHARELIDAWKEAQGHVHDTRAPAA